MTLDKTCEILTQLERTLAPTMTADGTDAIKLGIEAARELRRQRGIYGPYCVPLLPGETLE